jgi:hypothetical protein
MMFVTRSMPLKNFSKGKGNFNNIDNISKLSKLKNICHRQKDYLVINI